MRCALAIYQRQSVIMVLAMLAPAIANLLYYSGCQPVAGSDFTPVGFIVMGFLLTWAIFPLPTGGTGAGCPGCSSPAWPTG